MVEMGSLDSFFAATSRRKDALGLTTPVEILRNSGLNRTPEKRRFLAAIDARAIAAGVAPIPANY